MKILFIGSAKYDYLQDVLFSGLIKRLGSKNISTINFHKNYFLPIKHYPRNMGYHRQAMFTYSPLKRDFSKFDAVIVGSPKPDAFEIYHQVKNKIPAHCPTVFIDGGDLAGIGEDLKRLGRPDLLLSAKDKPFDLIFKREYLIDKAYPKHIFPFPFGINFNNIAPIKRLPFKYDVSFWAVESHPIRTQALQLIQNQYDCEQNGTVVNQNFKSYKRKGDFYLEELHRSKIILNFRGNGWDTLRYWEAPALGGFMISQKPGIVIPNNYQDGKHIAFVQEDLSNLKELCDYYLAHELERKSIAEKAAIHTRKFHSDTARADTVLEEIKKLY